MSSSSNNATFEANIRNIPAMPRANRATSSRRVAVSLDTDPIQRDNPRSASSNVMTDLEDSDDDTGYPRPPLRNHNRSISTDSQASAKTPLVHHRSIHNEKSKGKVKEAVDRWTPDLDAINMINDPFALPLPSQTGRNKDQETFELDDAESDNPFTTKEQPEEPNKWMHIAAEQYGSPENHLRELFEKSKELSQCAELFMLAWPFGLCQLGVQEFIEDVFCYLPYHEAEVSTCVQTLARRVNGRFAERPWTKTGAPFTSPPPMLVADLSPGVPPVQEPHLGDNPFVVEVSSHAVRRYSGNFGAEFRPEHEDRTTSPPPGFSVKVTEGKTEEYEIHHHPALDATPIGTPIGNGLPTSPVNETMEEWLGEGFFDSIPPVNMMSPPLVTPARKQKKSAKRLETSEHIISQEGESPVFHTQPLDDAATPISAAPASMGTFSIRSRLDSSCGSSTDSSPQSSPTVVTLSLAHTASARQRAQGTRAVPSSPTAALVGSPTENLAPSTWVTASHGSKPRPPHRRVSDLPPLPPRTKSWAPVRRPLAMLNGSYESASNEVTPSPESLGSLPNSDNWLSYEEGAAGNRDYGEDELERIQEEEEEEIEEPFPHISQNLGVFIDDVYEEPEAASALRTSVQSQFKVGEVTTSVMARSNESQNTVSEQKAITKARSDEDGEASTTFPPIQQGTSPLTQATTEIVISRPRVSFGLSAPSFEIEEQSGQEGEADAPIIPPVLSKTRQPATPYHPKGRLSLAPEKTPEGILQPADSPPEPVEMPFAERKNVFAEVRDINPFIDDPAVAEESISMIGPKGRRRRPQGKTIVTRATAKRGKQVVVEEKEVEVSLVVPSEKPVETPAEVQPEVSIVKSITCGRVKAKAVPKQDGRKGKANEVVEEPTAGNAGPVEEAPVPAVKRSRKRTRREVEKVIPEDSDFNRPTRRLRSHTKKAGGLS